MPTVDEMVSAIIVREGGYVNHPADRGGPTKFGVTQKTLSRYVGYAVTVADVESLSEDVAREIYIRDYYRAPGINTLPVSVQAFLFDSAVNHGPRRAIRFLQSVCNQAGYLPKLSEDGAVGPNTRKAAFWAEEVMGNVLLEALVEERRNFYRIIVQYNPSQQVFLKGWMNRVNEFAEEAA